MASLEVRPTGDYATRRGFESVREPMNTSDRGEQGITLVEMLVSIVILGILFSAVAAALINFSTASLNNERRVQATGFMSGAHEQLQTISWGLTAIYRDELEDVPDVEGFDPEAETFEGEPLVLIPGPGADPRNDLVPEPYVDDVEDGNYRIWTFVTYSAVVGDGDMAKRFTTIVEWDVLGRTATQRFQSLRAPSLANIVDNDPPEVQLFDVSPTSITLDDPATRLTTQSASVVAVFSAGVNSAQIIYEQFPTGTEPTGTEVSHQLDAVSSSITETGEFTRWTGELPVGSGPFKDEASEDQPLKLRGVSLVGDEAEQERNLRFSSEFSEEPPVVESASAAPAEVRVHGDNDDVRLCTDLVVEAIVSGLDPDLGIVRATFVGDDDGTGITLQPVSEPITEENHLFRYTFSEGSASPWDPPGKGANNAIEVEFNVRAVNPGDVGSEIVSTNTVSIRRQGAGSGTC